MEVPCVRQLYGVILIKCPNCVPYKDFGPSGAFSPRLGGLGLHNFGEDVLEQVLAFQVRDRGQGVCPESCVGTCSSGLRTSHCDLPFKLDPRSTAIPKLMPFNTQAFNIQMIEFSISLEQEPKSFLN